MASLKAKARATSEKPSVTPVGFGSLKHRPKPIHAPSSLEGRRDAAHAKAYR